MLARPHPSTALSIRVVLDTVQCCHCGYAWEAVDDAHRGQQRVVRLFDCFALIFMSAPGPTVSDIVPSLLRVAELLYLFAVLKLTAELRTSC